MNLYQTVFSASAEKYPENIALCLHPRSFTYQALSELTQRWALIIAQVNTLHLPIAIYGGRQWQMYAGILSILAAKSTYVPLNNKQPTSRNIAVLEQISCQVLMVAQGEEPRDLLSQCPHKLTVIYLGEDRPEWLLLTGHNIKHIDDFPSPTITYEQLETSYPQAKNAYILFTSGSTGVPKGIAVSQRNINSHIKRLDNLLEINATDRVSQFFELSFDLSVHDLFSCWAKGAALYVIPMNQLLCPINFIKQHQLTVFSAVASLLSFIDKFGLLTPNNLPSLRLSCFGGEKLLTEQALKWQMCANKSRVLNLYGPTECTITATCYELIADKPPASTSVPIGKALPGLAAILIKDNKQITSANTLAELYLAGDQLVDGYWQDKNKTEQAFIYLNTDERYYRTGDCAYFNDEGNLIFHARNDQQFSIAGHRVEAGDIEATVLAFSSRITWCTVRVIKDEKSGQSQILAFVETESLVDKQLLKQHCGTELPSYMVPDKFYCFEYLPRNLNGKVDIKSLQTLINSPEEQIC